MEGTGMGWGGEKKRGRKYGKGKLKLSHFEGSDGNVIQY